MFHRRGTVAKEKSSAESIKDKMSNSIKTRLLAWKSVILGTAY